MRKKLFAILMSAMMMVTFMPSMAFAAAATTPANSTTGQYEWAGAKDASDTAIQHKGKLIKTIAGTCLTPTYKVYECTTAGCGARYVEKIAANQTTAHGALAKNMMSPEAYIQAQIEYAAAVAALEATDFVQEKFNELVSRTAKNIATLLTTSDEKRFDPVYAEIAMLLNELDPRDAGTTANEIMSFYPDKIAKIQQEIAYKYMDANFLNAVCYVFAGVCPDCGYVTTFGEGDIVYHNPGKKVAPCASSYVCKKCQKTIINVADNSDNVKGVATLLADVANAVKNNKGTDKYGQPVDLSGSATKKAAYIAEKLADAAFFIDGSTIHKGTFTKTTAACGNNVYSMVCKDCGETVFKNVDVVITNGNHNFETLKVLEPTCVTPGLTVQRCADCGALKLNGIKVVPAKGHTKETVTVAPTCGKVGYTVTKCADCGITLGAIKNIKQPTGHKYKVETVYDATCESAGLVKLSCEKCAKANYYYGDEVTYDAKIAATVDDFNAIGEGLEYGTLLDPNKFVKVVTNRVHDVDGETTDDKSTTTYYFTGFGVLGVADAYAQKVVVPDMSAYGHKWNGWVKVKDATCVNPEVWVRECNTCGATDVHALANYAKYKKFTADNKRTKLVGVAKAHNIVTKTVAATCGNVGYKYKKCADCGLLFNEFGEATAATNSASVGFDFDYTYENVVGGCTWDGEYKTTKKATIFEPGCAVHTCSVCGAVADVTEADKDHTDDIVIPQLKYGAPSVKAGSKKATVKVLKKNGATKYTVQVRPYGKANNGQWKNAKIVTKAGNVVVKNLKSGKKYNFRIVATNQYGKKAHSKVTKGVKIK